MTTMILTMMMFRRCNPGRRTSSHHPRANHPWNRSRKEKKEMKRDDGERSKKFCFPSWEKNDFLLSFLHFSLVLFFPSLLVLFFTTRGLKKNNRERSNFCCNVIEDVILRFSLSLFCSFYIHGRNAEREKERERKIRKRGWEESQSLYSRFSKTEDYFAERETSHGEIKRHPQLPEEETWRRQVSCDKRKRQTRHIGKRGCEVLKETTGVTGSLSSCVRKQQKVILLKKIETREARNNWGMMRWDGIRWGDCRLTFSLMPQKKTIIISDDVITQKRGEERIEWWAPVSESSFLNILIIISIILRSSIMIIIFLILIIMKMMVMIMMSIISWHDIMFH